MLTPPPLPPYEGLHPLVVHFPIGILLIAWLPVLIGVADRSRRVTWLASGGLLLVLGTSACFAATLTGNAAESVVGGMSEAVDQALNAHQHTGNRARNLFLLTTVLFMAAWITCSMVSERKRKVLFVISAVIVASAYVVSAISLINAAHLGGVLVHHHGIHAPIVAP